MSSNHQKKKKTAHGWSHVGSAFALCAPTRRIPCTSNELKKKQPVTAKENKDTEQLPTGRDEEEKDEQETNVTSINKLSTVLNNDALSTAVNNNTKNTASKMIHWTQLWKVIHLTQL